MSDTHRSNVVQWNQRNSSFSVHAELSSLTETLNAKTGDVTANGELSVKNRPQGSYSRNCKIQISNSVFKSTNLDFEFVVPFDDNMEPNEAEIILYNLSESTRKEIKKNQSVTITAGYSSDTGVIFKGYVTSAKTTYEDADKITTVMAKDDIKNHTVENISFAAGTKASYILKTLIGKTGTPVAVFKMRRDHTYKDSQTVDGDLMENIKKYAQVCGVSVFVSKGKIYARHIKEGDNLNFVASSDTGMIGSPADYQEEIMAEDFTEVVNGYEVDMLLQHRMCPAAIIELDSRIAKGTYRVCKGEHRFNPDEAVTHIKMY